MTRLGIRAWCFALALVLLATAQARAGTLVTLGFDDDTPGQLRPAEVLDALGARATFYVNTGTIGRPGRMTWDQVRDLAARGHEIAGHGVRHIDATQLDDDELRANVCDDRDTLRREGFPALSYAYPSGHFTRAAQAIVRECGYLTARTVGGVAPSKVCSTVGRCPLAEAVPALDPFATRTSPPANHRTTVAALQEAVRRAEKTGGLLQLIFHRFDEGDPSSVRSTTFAAFARWLVIRQVLGTRVVTAAEAATATVATTPHAAPVVVVGSRVARVRPRDAVPHVVCPAACVVEVTVTPTGPAALALGARFGVPVAAGVAVLPRAGVAAVRLAPRPSTAAAWGAEGAPLPLRIRSVVTTVGPATSAGTTGPPDTPPSARRR